MRSRWNDAEASQLNGLDLLVYASRLVGAETSLVIWGGIHAQVRPEDCLEHADVICRSEGEYALAEITDRLSLGQDIDDVAGCWVRGRNGEITQNDPRFLIPELVSGVQFKKGPYFADEGDFSAAGAASGGAGRGAARVASRPSPSLI